MSFSLQRRGGLTALALVMCGPGAISIAKPATGLPVLARATLATPDQIASEQLALQILAAPQIKQAKAQILERLLADADVQGSTGKDQARRVLDQWTTYLAFNAAFSDTQRPRVVTVTDNRPHSWSGQPFPVSALPISNPDNIYRSSLIDGESRYALHGHFGNPRAGQFSIELSRKSIEGDLSKQSKTFGDMGNQVVMITDDTIRTEPDGSFTILIDPDPSNGRANHIQTVPGPLLLHYRDSLSDWRQEPTRLVIRNVSAPDRAAPTLSYLVKSTAAKLPDYVTFWQDFKNSFLGTPDYNTLAGPYRRDGGWGYSASGRFQIAADEALVVIVHNDRAAYTGFQIADPWMVTPDPSKFLISRNKAQSVPDGDGRYTYVVSAKDPGVANWIETAGLSRGWLQIRWQGVTPGSNGKGFLESVALVKFADLHKTIPADVAKSAPERRRRERTERVTTYPIR